MGASADMSRKEPSVSVRSTASDGTKKIVICFDGTGNQFSGDANDTNIVKLYQMLDRTTPDQYHYYQPGIGTYVSSPLMTTHTNPIKSLNTKISMTLDAMYATSFVSHVLAGYTFLMRYYTPGDKVYIFGFSRGAYTARFLAEMIYHIGLLSKGNEEMTRFAWTAFATFQRHRDDPKGEKQKVVAAKFMDNFKRTFCREEIKIHFLGLFDCVNSVSEFEIPFSKRASPYIPIPPAVHVRHAVSIHEHRTKFKPALFNLGQNEQTIKANVDTMEEVWFAGSHCDIGGGWGPQGDDGWALSDIALKWMLDELNSLPDEDKLHFQDDEVANFNKAVKNYEDALEGPAPIAVKGQAETLSPLRRVLHDALTFRTGTPWMTVLRWKFFEILPLKRYELIGKKWTPVSWPPGYGRMRDIPENAKIDPSVYKLQTIGVLKMDELPALGGDGDHVSVFARFWRWLTGYKPKDD